MQRWRTYASQGLAYAHVLMTASRLTTWGVYSVAQLTFKQLFENIGSQCVAMRTSRSINWVDSSNCESSGALSTQCANHFPNTTASLEAGHQHNLLQHHGLNLRCVQETNWWHGRSSCATSWEMRGNQWMMKVPFIRLVAVLSVRKWRPKRNQNIIIFPKKCVYKLKNINSVKKYI